MKFLYFFVFLFILVQARKRCFPVNEAPKRHCNPGEIYQKKGPGPFCYRTCCGPQRPPCLPDSFTTGCFCPEGFIKLFPVANNTYADPKNPCVKNCNGALCQINGPQATTTPKPTCTGAHQVYLKCGPVWECNDRVCKGMGVTPPARRPITGCTPELSRICIAGCFCKKPYKMFGDECVNPCPLVQ